MPTILLEPFSKDCLDFHVTRRASLSITLSDVVLLNDCTITATPWRLVEQRALSGPRRPNIKSRGSRARNLRYETSADAARQLEPGSGEFRCEAKKLPAVSPFRIGQSRSRPFQSPDRLPTVDGPVAKSQTRDRVNWLAVQMRVPAFFQRPEAGHSVVSWMGAVGGFRSRQRITWRRSRGLAGRPSPRSGAASVTSSPRPHTDPKAFGSSCSRMPRRSALESGQSR
jgi:hypothetical protein